MVLPAGEIGMLLEPRGGGGRVACGEGGKGRGVRLFVAFISRLRVEPCEGLLRGAAVAECCCADHWLSTPRWCCSFP